MDDQADVRHIDTASVHVGNRQNLNALCKETLDDLFAVISGEDLAIESGMKGGCHVTKCMLRY